MEIKWNQNCRY